MLREARPDLAAADFERRDQADGEHDGQRNDYPKGLVRWHIGVEAIAEVQLAAAAS